MVYIAAAAVIGLLIGFVTLSIDWLRKTVMRNIRSKTMGLLSVYDELLEEKSRELALAAREEAERARSAGDGDAEKSAAPIIAAPAAQPPLPPVSLVDQAGASEYRDGSIGGVYCAIRQGFSFRLEELLPSLDTGPAAAPGRAGRLLRELDFDTVYQLSTLQPEEQVEILRESLPEDGNKLLEDYLETAGQFHAPGFYDYLRTLAETEPKAVTLWVPAELAGSKRSYGNVEIIPDSGICEGFQVEEDHMLYDCCIKARELS